MLTRARLAASAPAPVIPAPAVPGFRRSPTLIPAISSAAVPATVTARVPARPSIPSMKLYKLMSQTMPTNARTKPTKAKERRVTPRLNAGDPRACVQHQQCRA